MMFYRPLADRTGEDVEQAAIHVSSDFRGSLDAGDDEIEERARLELAELRRHRHVPAARVREGRAFYGIFLRHEHGQCVAETQIRFLVRMVVRKRMFDELEARGPQRGEEALRIADRRDRMHGAA